MAKFAVVISLLSLLALPSVALADVISPDEEACSGKSAGDACDMSGTAGTCSAEKCSRLDYSNGTPPSTIEVDCVLCKEGSGAPVGPDAGAPPATDTGSTTAPTTTETETNDGCAGGAGPLSLASLLAGLALFGLLLARRRA